MEGNPGSGQRTAKQEDAKERLGSKKSRRHGKGHVEGQDVGGTSQQRVEEAAEVKGRSRGDKCAPSSSTSPSSHRPKRNAAKRASAYLLEKQTTALFWKEERDLKKALEASLTESRKEAKRSAKASLRQAAATSLPPPPPPSLPPPALGSKSKPGGGERPESRKCQNSEKARRPKRLSAQRAATYLMDEQTNSFYWNEDRDLKKALRASLTESKKIAATTNSEPTQSGSQSQSSETATNGNSRLASPSNSKTNDLKAKRNSKLNKGLNHLLSCDASNEQEVSADSSITNGNDSCTKKPRIHSQRKFAQGAATFTPSSTPVKIESVISVPMTEVFTRCRPATEDFLTFLCLRGSSILPPNLDFCSLNSQPLVGKEKEKVTRRREMPLDSEVTSSTLELTPVPKSVTGKRTSNSSILNHPLNDPGFGKNAPKKVIAKERNSTKESTASDWKPIEAKPKLSSENASKANVPVKKGYNLGNSMETSPVKKCSVVKASVDTKSTKKTQNISNLEDKVSALKEKYKLQRLARKGSISLSKISPTKSPEETSIIEKPSKVCTRRGSVADTKESGFDMTAKSSLGLKPKRVEKYSSAQRVLRSHHLDISEKRPVGRPPNSSSNCCKSAVPLKITKRTLSPLGLRPHERKAKPKTPLIDYNYESDSGSDVGKQSKRKLPSQGNNCLKNSFKKMMMNSSPTILLKRTPVLQQEAVSGPKSVGDKTGKSGNNRNKAGTAATMISKRVTRSSSNASSHKEEDTKERERKIKEQILEIERKEKLKIALRRCSSESSLHSSSSSSSSSSESLPSSDSSSSINIPRVTRSIEHLKQLRILAKKQKPKRRRDPKGKSTKKCKSGLRGTKTPHNVTKHLGNKTCDGNRIGAASDKKSSLERKKGRVKKKTLHSAKDRLKPNSKAKGKERKEVGLKRGKRRKKAFCGLKSNSSESNDIDRTLQSMAEGIQSLDDASGEDHCVPDLVYCDTEPIQGLMTTEFSGGFAEETFLVSTASAMLLPSSSASSSNLSASAQTCPSFFQPADAATSSSRLTVDASTNTVEEEILACVGANEDKAGVKCGFDSSIGTQTTPVGSPESDSGDSSDESSLIKTHEEGSQTGPKAPAPTPIPAPALALAPVLPPFSCSTRKLRERCKRSSDGLIVDLRVE